MTSRPTKRTHGAFPPLAVQSWPSCERNLTSYASGPDEFRVDYVNLHLRGVPAAEFEDGHRVELYTGDSTVIITGEDPAQVMRAAEVVRLHGVAGTPPMELPTPVPGALDGTLPCALQAPHEEAVDGV